MYYLNIIILLLSIINNVAGNKYNIQTQLRVDHIETKWQLMHRPSLGKAVLCEARLKAREENAHL